MRIFFSVGEPSGDLHGANLIRTLRERDPSLEFVGFGGERMAEAGCKLLYPLCNLAVMWFLQVLAHAWTFVKLVRQADAYLRDHRPDVVVLIDYPGFNWHIARLAKARGIPVFYFVPPQLWAWAGWRVRKMRRTVDRVLCSLPFEEAWYRERNVPARYVGHPYFDELTHQRLDDDFVARQQARGGRIIALLPGSRNQEIERNLATQLRAAAVIHADLPDTRFLIACLHDRHRERVEQFLRDPSAADLAAVLPAVEVHAGKTPEIIQACHSAIAVSGSVGLELLYRCKPTVVVYRVRNEWDMWLVRRFMKCRFISLVNLLADRELFPEFLTPRCPADVVAEHLAIWLKQSAAYERRCGELRELCNAVAAPGATSRAAECILDVLVRRDRSSPPLAA